MHYAVCNKAAPLNINHQFPSLHTVNRQYQEATVGTARRIWTLAAVVRMVNMVLAQVPLRLISASVPKNGYHCAHIYQCTHHTQYH